MRREYGMIGGGEDTPPFAENLVFWAPLKHGDLKDHISGVDPISDSGCSITWDAAKQMYKFYAYGAEKSAANYNGVRLGLSNNSPLTMFIILEEVALIGNNYEGMIGTPRYVAGSASLYMRHYAFSQSSQPIRELNRYVLVYNGSTFKSYKNGALVATNNISDTIRLTNNIVQICLLPRNNTSYTFYAYDARIYNRVLTDQEIAQL